MPLRRSLTRSCAVLLQTRSFQNSAVPVTASARHERLEIPCRSNGFITIDVFRASQPLMPVILYLPSGPVLSNSNDGEERVISNLLASSSATIAQIHYRASSTHQYPQPYHDVLFGYDWVLANLLQDGLGHSRLARVGVCGQLMGGALATMLGLTECRIGESRVGAAAINNPITDWVLPDTLPHINKADLPEPVSPDETAVPADEDLSDSPGAPKAPTAVRRRSKRKSASSPLTSWKEHGYNTIVSSSMISAARHALFRKPEDYFDRFASPIHFFRSPHAQLLQPEADDVLASKQPDETLDMEAQFALDHYSSFEEQKEVRVLLPQLTRCRTYARNYPPATTQLSLPVWSVTTGSQSLLADQALELVKVLRRSIARQSLKSHTGRARWHDSFEKNMYEVQAQERVKLDIVGGIGLWTHSNEGVRNIFNTQELGKWMKEKLRPEFT